MARCCDSASTHRRAPAPPQREAAHRHWTNPVAVERFLPPTMSRGWKNARWAHPPPTRCRGALRNQNSLEGPGWSPGSAGPGRGLRHRHLCCRGRRPADRAGLATQGGGGAKSPLGQHGATEGAALRQQVDPRHGVPVAALTLGSRVGGSRGRAHPVGGLGNHDDSIGRSVRVASTMAPKSRPMPPQVYQNSAGVPAGVRVRTCPVGTGQHHRLDVHPERAVGVVVLAVDVGGGDHCRRRSRRRARGGLDEPAPGHDEAEQLVGHAPARTRTTPATSSKVERCR